MFALSDLFHREKKTNTKMDYSANMGFTQNEIFFSRLAESNENMATCKRLPAGFKSLVTKLYKAVEHRIKEGCDHEVFSPQKKDYKDWSHGEQFKTIKPMKYKPTKKISNISERITYSGFPSSHKLMTIRGRVAGYADKAGSGRQIILHTYGWFGCSGSVIYNSSGEVVGVLWGVDAEYYPTMAIIEDMIWVVPIRELDIEVPINRICRYNKMKFC